MDMSNIIRVYSLATNQYHLWVMPTKQQILDNYRATYGKQYNRHERTVVEGGVPLPMRRIAPEHRSKQ